MQERFFHYTLITEIGSSASNTTYLAFPEARPDQKVILKTFSLSSFIGQLEQRQRVLNMADKLKQLSHPHLVPILEAGIEEGQAYIVSEYIPGGSLRTRLDRAYPKTFPAQQVLPIITQVGQALDALHRLQIVHGHLKPEYILFDINRQALLSGVPLIARSTPAQDDPEKVAYNRRYRAPEQFQGQGDALSDQYALCCIAYELLTGQPPFTEASVAAHVQSKNWDNPTSLSALVPGLPATVDEAILRGLAADPSSRHPDISALLALLQSPLSFATSTVPTLPLPRAKRVPATAVLPGIDQLSPEPASRPLLSTAWPDPLLAVPPAAGNVSTEAAQPDLASREKLAREDTLPNPAAFGVQTPGAPGGSSVPQEPPPVFQPQAAQARGQSQTAAQTSAASPGNQLAGRAPQFARLPPLRRPQAPSFKRAILPLLGILLFTGSLIAYSVLMSHPISQNQHAGSTATAGQNGNTIVLSTAAASPSSGTKSTPGSTPTRAGAATATPTTGVSPAPTATPTFVRVVSALGGSYREYNQFTNLTSTGTLDWVHWGYQGGVNRKTGNANLVSDYSLQKGGTVHTNGTWPIDFGWNNGTPTASVSRTTSCIYVTGVNNGFTVSVPASTSTRTLSIYVGVYKGKGRLSAWIIGGPSYSNASLDMSTDPNLADNAVYTLTYKSNVPGTRLYVSWTLASASSSSGNVQLEAAALAG
ncbi:MAG TPA: protein kinase [Ktedonobacteraceae bacterium]